MLGEAKNDKKMMQSGNTWTHLETLAVKLQTDSVTTTDIHIHIHKQPLNTVKVNSHSPRAALLEVYSCSRAGVLVLKLKSMV